MTIAKSAQPTLRIGDVAHRTGLSVHALRFYERENLLVGPIFRDTGGRRRYTLEDVEWLGICVRLRESGMPLTDLRKFAELVRHGPGNETQRLELLRKHEQHVQTQLAALRHCLDVIHTKVSIYQEKVDQSVAQGTWDPFHKALQPGSSDERPRSV